MKPMTSRRINTVALLLVIATGLSWWLGESPAHSGDHLGTAVLAVLALSAFKGALIALEYMELRCAPALWRRAVMGWLVVVLGLIAVATLWLPR
jgi:apolipoprotein N-acyltransferase